MAQMARLAYLLQLFTRGMFALRGLSAWTACDRRGTLLAVASRIHGVSPQPHKLLGQYAAGNASMYLKAMVYSIMACHCDVEPRTQEEDQHGRHPPIRDPLPG